MPTSASTVARYASGVPNDGAGPAVGHLDHTWERKLAYPLSSPCQ
ncbi:hypothetical protein OJAG_03310 [Oerskovia enterophila]|uniref:Uncharacterized protein n=1 Tax=Oerskovia enterophila TaxID=43678 RepID=A0A161YKH2_9CELL|nr:hypothetical protein OJAG_03310 [Oerskovia enterophila]